MSRSFIILTTLFFYQCVEPFDFKSPEVENFLVVDGSVTNELKYHEVTVAYSGNLDGLNYAGIPNATVQVLNQNGDSYNYDNVENGLYRPVNPFEGIVGNSYKLRISTGETIYETDFQELLQPSEIDSVYEKYIEVIEKESGINKYGFQFFLDSDDPNGSATFYRYDWHATYKILVPFPSEYIYNPDTDEAEFRTEQVGTCFAYDSSKIVLINRATSNNDSKILEYPVWFLPSDNIQIRTRYSLLARQYAISEEAYDYYRQLKEANETGGSLFDQQQGAVLGNLKSLTNPDEPVLGYFEVSGVSENRTFHNSADLEQKYKGQFRRPGFQYTCDYNGAFIVAEDSLGYYYENAPSFQIYRIVRPPASEPVGAYLYNRTCTDCTWYANPTPPEYWID